MIKTYTNLCRIFSQQNFQAKETDVLPDTVPILTKALPGKQLKR